MQTNAARLSDLLGGELLGEPETLLTGAAAIQDAGPGDVVLAEGARYLAAAAASNASCIIVDQDAAAKRCDKCLIRVQEPAEAFARVLALFRPEESLPAKRVSSSALVEPDVTLGTGVAIGDNCWIGSGAMIGDGAVLFPNVYVGNGARIGEASKLYPGVVVYAGCVIGRRVVLHAGVVVGADGFGYFRLDGKPAKYPHVGTVEIGDDVEIGANSTVDRAKTGATVIGDNTKIDNLVHIAHNVRIGANCIIVALSGVAGSATIGDNVTLAAQTGVRDHVCIGDGSVVAARAGVIGDLADGSVVSGFPARDHRREMRVEAARLHLPEILRRLRALEDKLGSRGNSGNGDS